MSMFPEYICTNGHGKCSEMYPGPECPHCETRDPIAERVTAILASIENARARLDALRGNSSSMRDWHSAAYDELVKILATKDSYDRTVKS